MRGNEFAVLGGVVLVLACGGSAPQTAAGSLSASAPVASALQVTLPPLGLQQATPFYRVELQRTVDGALHWVQVRNLELTRQPLPALNAEYLAVAYAGDSVVAAVPVAFPQTALGFGRVDGVPTHTRLPIAEPLSTVFVPADPSVDRITIVAPPATSVLELKQGDLPAASTDKALPPLGSFGQARQPLSRDELLAKYDGVAILEPADEKLLPKDVVGGGSIVATTEQMNDTISDGLSALGPNMLGTVQTLAVMKWPEGSPLSELSGYATGSTLALNVEYMGDDAEMVTTIVHENAHNLEDLADAAAGVSSLYALGAWDEKLAAASKAVVQQYHLVQGLVSAWRDLHKTGLSKGYTTDYSNDVPTPSKPAAGLTDDVARSEGFATQYGSTSAWEDLAEYVGTVQARTDLVPGICPLFAGAGSLTPAIAIPYAKLTLLLGLGAITEEAFQSCVQGATISEESGIRFSDGISFSSGLKAGKLPADVGVSYGVLGTGPNSYQLLLKIWISDPEGSALGLHRLQEVWYDGADGSALTGALLGNDDPFRARVSQTGLMLITDARPELTAGAIFGLVLQNAAGIPTDNLAFGTFHVP